MSAHRGRRERRIWGPDVSKDVDEELAYHLELQQRDYADSIARVRAEWDVARLMFVLAGLAGLLAAVGLYGVVAFGVESRRREFGIRIALGAPPRRVAHLVLRRTGSITTAGLVLGAAGAIGLGQVLESRLVGVHPFDPIVWLLACAGLVAIAAAASFIPARRAMRVDLTETLRAL
jgi:putative ABC transport system permease protein